MKLIVKLSFLATATIMVLGIFSFIPINKVEGSNGSTLYVGGNGPGNYTSIQSAINDASDGDTVFVYSGTYDEAVVINRAVNLFGEDRSSTVIKGWLESCGVSINSQGVRLSGFNIFGIYLESSSNTNITGNTITNDYDDAIHLYYSCSYNTITGNTISQSYDDGIQLESSCSYNTIAGNTITNNYDDGIDLESSCSYNTITGNTIIQSYDCGINIEASSNNNAIMGNTITNNNYGIYLDSSSGNKIYHNNFINNAIHASTSSTGANEWDNDYLSGGNYWNTYTGVDANGDHIGDTPYDIPGGNNLDRYPLMNPYSPTINQPPTCILSANPTIGQAPLMVTFTLSASDPDGSIATWALDINNDGTPEYSGLGNPPATQQHTYTISGANLSYLIELTVTDNSGATGTDIATVTVSSGNQPPACSLLANPSSGTVPLMVTFTLSVSDPDGSIATWALDINNDGTPEYSGSGTPPGTKQHIYQTIGTYTAKLTVTDNQSKTDSDTTVITVSQSSQNQLPIAHFTYSCDEYIVTFTDASTDSDGSIISWYWDFGDQNHSVTESPIHEYGEGGEYTVKLIVTDDDGGTDNFTQVITFESEDGDGGDGDGGDNGIPGFEMALLVIAVISLLMILKRKR